ncbi:Plectin/S10 domain-containing protein, partial [Entophlyctis helioformis]
MLILKEDRKKIYQYLFQEGVFVVKKDTHLAKHADVDVPNLQVMKALQSLESRGFVKSQFSWQYYYYFLTNEGIEYLREFLHLPAEIVPRTFIKTTKTLGTRPGARGTLRLLLECWSVCRMHMDVGMRANTDFLLDPRLGSACLAMLTEDRPPRDYKPRGDGEYRRRDAGEKKEGGA